MVTDRDSIFAVLHAQEDRVRALGVRRLGLFGSVAVGGQTESSDLDFLVEFDRPTFDAYMDLKFLLEDTFRCSVDLVLVDAIKPRLRATILNQVRYAPGFENLS